MYECMYVRMYASMYVSMCICIMQVRARMYASMLVCQDLGCHRSRVGAQRLAGNFEAECPEHYRPHLPHQRLLRQTPMSSALLCAFLFGTVLSALTKCFVNMGARLARVATETEEWRSQSAATCAERAGGNRPVSLPVGARRQKTAVDQSRAL